MIIFSALIGALGIVGMISKKTFLGLLIGMQFLILGATLTFVIAGISSGLSVQGHIFGLFVMFGGIAQLVLGYALAVRFFFSKKKTSIDQLQILKR